MRQVVHLPGSGARSTLTSEPMPSFEFVPVFESMPIFE
jgi:hypothetical protein